MPVFAGLLLAAPMFAPAVPWANGFSPADRIPFVADVNGDGYADFITVSPGGDAFIDVALNSHGQKSAIPRRALDNFGKDLAKVEMVDGAIYALGKDGTIHRASGFSGGGFKSNDIWLKPMPPSPAVPTPAIAGSKDSIWREGDMDHDGDLDLIEFRRLNLPHDGNNVLVYRGISAGETDSDADGISNVEETKLGTDPLNPDTDNDGLLDGWEVGGFHDLDLKTMGCDPKHADVICLISRFAQVDEAFCKDQLTNAQKYYAGIDSPNPDGQKGWNLHFVYLPALNEEEQKKPWYEQRDIQIPSKWKGVVHWMQISPWGGGQADQLGDGGGCGGGGWALYATFVHEFGHQLGLSHEGFYDAAWCPTYPSLMNYAYSYTLEGDIKNVRYSDGRLANYTMRESDLSEVIPLPYEKVKFLEQAPYHYRLKADGDKTLVDWNWNGVFGEQHIRADINYSYSTTAGRRDNVGKLHSAPWLLTSQGSAYALFARHDFPVELNKDSSISVTQPGSLYLRKLITPYNWAPEQKVSDAIVTGDPVAVDFGGKIVAVYQTAKGVQVSFDFKSPITLGSSNLVPSIVVVEGRLLLTLWNNETGAATYAWWTGRSFGEFRTFNFKSRSALGLAVDSIQNRLIVGLSQDQAGKPSRWQVRRYSISGDTLFERSKEWIEGEAGGARGSSRSIVLFDPDKSWGPSGRTYYFALGTTSEKSPWSCEYVAHTIGDTTVSGGWRVKRYYDEWTQSRSAPAAAFYHGDIIYGYRWADGGNVDGDNVFHVAYRGSGIEDAPMGDFNDIGFIRDFGMRYSILYMAN